MCNAGFSLFCVRVVTAATKCTAEAAALPPQTVADILAQTPEPQPRRGRGRGRAQGRQAENGLVVKASV